MSRLGEGSTNYEVGRTNVGEEVRKLGRGLQIANYRLADWRKSIRR